MKKLIQLVAGTILAVALSNAYVAAYVRISSGNTATRRPDINNVQFYLNDQTRAGLPNITSDSDPRGAIESAMRSWMRIPTAQVNFAPLQTTSIATSQYDGINIISFADTPESRSLTGGTLAVTKITFLGGDIVDTDIIFSNDPRVVFSTTLQPNTYDLESVAVHELGHSLGANHSGLLSATMFQSTGQKVFSARTLSLDDEAFITDAYPRNGGAASPDQIFGTLSGSVTANGQPVFGALVAAIDSTRLITLGGITGTNGRFTIKSVPKGDYQVYAEPLDGPVRPANLGSGFSGANTAFATTFWGGNPTPATITIDGGAVISNIDIVAASGTPGLNILIAGRTVSETDTHGRLTSGLFSASPGESFFIIVAGDGFDSGRLTSINQVRILGQGVTVRPDTRLVTFNGISLSNIGFLVDVAAAAEPGARTIVVDDGTTVSAFTGGLQIMSPAPLTERLIFPFLASTGDSFTGVALVNLGNTPTVASITAYSDAGERIAGVGVKNTRNVSLPANKQLAELGNEIFKFPSDGQPRQGWMEVAYAPGSQMRGFFLLGDTTGSAINGADTSGQLLSTDLLFLNTPQGGGKSTTIIAVNPSEADTASATFALMRNDGATLATANRTIRAKGRVAETIQQLFGTDSVGDEVYVRASSNVRLVGFEVIRTDSPKTALTLNAQPTSSATGSLFSPQLASGSFGGVIFTTRFCLVNPNSSAVMASANAVDETGNPLGTPATLTIPGGGITCSTADTLFNLGAAAVTGSARITSSGGAIQGGVIFTVGDPNQPTTGSALPLTVQPSSNLVYSHVAQALGFLTGLAFFNTSDGQTASIRIDVFDSNGNRTGSATSGSPGFPSLGPGQRLSRSLSELVPSVTNQVGGFIKVTSTAGLASFELFTSQSPTGSLVLASVPPQ